MAAPTSTVEPETTGSAQRPFPPVPLVIVSVLGLIVAATLQAATGNRSGAGAVLAGLGSLWAVLFVVVGFLVYRPWAAALLPATPPPSARRQLRTVLLLGAPIWWAAVIATILFAPSIADTMPTDAFSPVPAGRTAVPFGELLRHLGFTQIYSIRPSTAMAPFGWIAATGMAAALLLPLTGRVLHRLGGGSREDRRRLQWFAVAVAVAVSILFRLLMVFGVTGWADGSAGAQAARTWLPNHLDLFALGMAIAVLDVERSDGNLGATVAGRLQRLTSNGARLFLGAAGGLLLLILGIVWTPTPEQPLPSAIGELLMRIGVFAAAAAIAAPALLRSRPEPALVRDRRRDRALMAGAAAMLLWFRFVLDRWVSADPLTPARRAGELFSVPAGSTLAFVLAGVIVATVAGWFLVQRPAATMIDRRFGLFRGGMWAITATSFLTRIWGMGAVTANNPGNGDPFFYHAQANMLADRVGFGEPIQWLTEGRFVPTAIHPPIYTLWLTPSSILGARGFLAHKTMGAIAGVLVVVVAGLLVRHLAGDRAGLIAAAIVALYPNLWLIDGTLWPEGLYTATIGLALLTAYRWRDRPTIGAAIALGLACGVAILTRGEALALLPLLCLPLALSVRREQKDWFRQLVIMGLAAGLLLVPWIVRNQMQFGEFVAVSTNSEEVLFYANCEDVYHGEAMGFWSFGCQERIRREREAEGLPPDPPGNEAQKARAWGELGRRYALDHKRRLPAVAAARVARAWDVRYAEHNVRALTIEGRPRPWAQAGLWTYRIVAVVGLAGLVVLHRRGTRIWPLVMTIAMVTAIAVYAYGHVRFRTAGDLVLIVGAAVLIDSILPERRSIEP